MSAAEATGAGSGFWKLAASPAKAEAALAAAVSPTRVSASAATAAGCGRFRHRGGFGRSVVFRDNPADRRQNLFHRRFLGGLFGHVGTSTWALERGHSPTDAD